MKVSVITLSKNHASALRATLDSVARQSLKECEHIVIDAASIDNTVEVLKQYPSVKFVSEPDKGFEDAFNKGLRMATGDYIACCNIWDEYIDDNWLQDVTKLLDSQRELSLIWGRFVDVNEAGNYDAPVPFDWYVKESPQEEALLHYFLMAPWCTFTETTLVAPKEVFLRCFPSRKCETDDHDAWLDFFYSFHSHGHLARFLPRVVNTVKTHTSSRIKNEAQNGIFRRRAITFGLMRKSLRYRVFWGKETMVLRDRNLNPLARKFQLARYRRFVVEYKFRMFWLKKILKKDASWKHPEIHHETLCCCLRNAGLMEY